MRLKHVQSTFQGRKRGERPVWNRGDHCDTTNAGEAKGVPREKGGWNKAQHQADQKVVGGGSGQKRNGTPHPRRAAAEGECRKAQPCPDAPRPLTAPCGQISSRVPRNLRGHLPKHPHSALVPGHPPQNAGGPEIRKAFLGLTSK